MVGSDVPGRIQVRVEGEAALLAAEVAPAPAVGLLSVPAPAALLAGVAGVDRINNHTHQRRLVACEPEQASKGPRVQAPTLPLASLHAGTDVGQVLEDQRGAWLHGLDQALGQHVVTVPAETFLAARHLAQVPLGRPCAFRLKSAAQTERAVLDLPPAASTEELGLGGHGGARHAEVNTDHLSRGLDLRLRGFDHDMQPKPTLAVYAEVGRANRQIHTPRMAKGMLSDTRCRPETVASVA